MRQRMKFLRLLINFLMNKKKTVIFGGSFDPIHVGHLALASAVCRAGLGEEVWFMVSPHNPHKEQDLLSNEKVRLEMVRLAVIGNERFKACDFEFSLPRPSYTCTTLLELEKAFPDREFILLIGADNWNVFNRWYNADKILDRYGIIVYPRDNSEKPELPAGVVWLSAELHDVSSTMIRNAIAKGQDVKGLLPQAVEQFIKDNKLYR